MAIKDFFRLPPLTRKGLTSERSRFQHERRTIADEDFISSNFSEVTDATDQKLLIVLRQIVGDMCGIPSQILRGDDLTHELDKLMGFTGFDLTLFIQLFEKKLGIELDDSFPGGAPPTFEAWSRARTLREWIREMLPWVKSTVQSSC
jgi:hypothetical protein